MSDMADPMAMAMAMGTSKGSNILFSLDFARDLSFPPIVVLFSLPLLVL